MFIPSGGGQWAVQGPIMIEAAKVLNANPSFVVLGVAYGDQWTNMTQPFGQYHSLLLQVCICAK